MSKKGTSTAIARRSTAVAQQQQAIDKMGKELRKVYHELREERVGLVNTGLHYYRALGEHIEQVTADTNKYGAGAIKLLATALDASSDLLYKAASFFRNYSEQEFADLLALRTSTDDGLTWTHVINLLAIDDHKKRTRLQEHAAKMNWTAEELREAVIEQLGEKAAGRKSGSGPKHVQPKSTMQGLKNYCVGAGEFVRRSSGLWDEFFETAYQVPPDTVDNPALEQVERVVTMAEQAAKAAQQQLAAATKVRDRYREIVKARTPKEADEDEDEEDEE